jgi:protein O-GlcNAc transferase
MIAAFAPEGNHLRPVLSGGHISVVSRQREPFVPSEAFETAFSLHGQGRLEEAEALYRAVLRAEPGHPGSLHHLGVVKAQQGNLNEAIWLIRRALEKQPQSAEVHSDLGVALEYANRYPEALLCYARALELKPDCEQALFNSGNALQALERHYEAIMRFQAVVRLKPDHAEARNNLGKSLSALGRHGEAIEQFEHALASNPRYADPEHNLSTVLHSLGRYREALAHAHRALALKPSHSKAHNSAGNSLRQLNRPAEAIRHFEQAIALEPSYPEAHYNLGSILKELGKREEALGQYQTALELKPDLAEARFALWMAQLPIVYRWESEIAERRLAYQQQLIRLQADVESGVATGDLAEGLGSNLPFYLAYQGFNDCDLQIIYGALASRIMAERYPAVRIADPPGSGERVRVGIVSGFFRQHSVWKIPTKGWLSQLDRRRFQVFGYHIGVEQDAQTTAAASLCDRFVQGPLPLDRWREAILSDASHVLIYPEIGMDGTSLVLAAQRLAAAQCNGLGHPGTSGLPTMDYVLGSDLMEPPNGAEHYTERLLRLPNLAVHYESPDVQLIPFERSELGLRGDSVAYLSGQSLFKYLPQYDHIYPRITREVDNCQFAFIEYRVGNEVTEIFRKRLGDAFAGFGLKASDYCVILPRFHQDRFISAIGQCDVILDSIGWSGNNSTFESLNHGLPVVALKGQFMRGRHSAAILERMGSLTRLRNRSTSMFRLPCG